MYARSIEKTKYGRIRERREKSSFCTNDKPPQRGGAVPFLRWGGLKLLVNSYPRAISPWTTLLVFYPCCPMHGHIWTAFLNPIDPPPISSTFFPTTLLSLFLHPKPPLPILLTAASYPYTSSHQR